MKRGLARDPKTLPLLERGKQCRTARRTVELLKVLLRMTAERHGVAAKVIATVDDLERIAADDEADVPALKGWRREMFGEKAIALKHGRLALAIEKGRVVAVERELRLLDHASRLAPDQARELTQAVEHPLAGERRKLALQPQHSCRARPATARAAARQASRPKPGRRPASRRRARAHDRACGSDASSRKRGDSSSSISPTWRKKYRQREKSAARMIDRHERRRAR